MRSSRALHRPGTYLALLSACNNSNLSKATITQSLTTLSCLACRDPRKHQAEGTNTTPIKYHPLLKIDLPSNRSILTIHASVVCSHCFQLQCPMVVCTHCFQLQCPTFIRRDYHGIFLIYLFLPVRDGATFLQVCPREPGQAGVLEQPNSDRPVISVYMIGGCINLQYSQL